MRKNPKVRLLQIVDSLHAGGMENIMVQVLNRLDPEKYEATVCCLSREGPFAERLPDRVQRAVLGKEPGFQWKTVKDLRTLMNKGFDVVHTHHLGGLIYAALAKPWPKTPRIIHSEHILLDGWELNKKRIWQRKLLYNRVACVFTVSTQQLQQLQKHDLHHRTMFTLHNGVDGAKFSPPQTSKAEARESLGLDPDGLWLGNVARFAPAKRHMDLIEAFERASTRHPQLRLLLVGDGGPEKERVLARVAASPLATKIHWAGLQQNPAPWYQAMDALVMASENEGLPNAALEGMACGLPLLANHACGVREVATDGEHGLLDDYSTVDLLTQGIERLAALPLEALQTKGRTAHEHVQAHFSIDAMMAKYDRMYTAVGTGQGSPI